MTDCFFPPIFPNRIPSSIETNQVHSTFGSGGARWSEGSGDGWNSSKDGGDDGRNVGGDGWGGGRYDQWGGRSCERDGVRGGGIGGRNKGGNSRLYGGEDDGDSRRGGKETGGHFENEEDNLHSARKPSSTSTASGFSKPSSISSGLSMSPSIASSSGLSKSAKELVAEAEKHQERVPLNTPWTFWLDRSANMCV